MYEKLLTFFVTHYLILLYHIEIDIAKDVMIATCVMIITMLLGVPLQKSKSINSANVWYNGVLRSI